MRTLLWFLLVWTSFEPVVAQDAFERAVAAQQNGDPTEAVREYRQLLTSGSHAPELYHNLGRAYLDLDSLGLAILHLERAHRWSPGDARIQASLEEARDRVPDALPVVPELFLKRWWRWVTSLLSAAGWLVLGQIIFWGSLVGWFLFLRRNFEPRIGILLLASVFVGLLAIALGFSRDRLLGDSGGGIVIQRTELYAAPDGTSAAMRMIPEGTAFAERERLGTWRYVELANGESGWVEERWAVLF